MTEYQRLIAGAEAAIQFSEELIDEAYYEVPRHQVYDFTANHRRLLKAQVNWLAELTGKKG